MPKLMEYLAALCLLAIATVQTSPAAESSPLALSIATSQHSVPLGSEIHVSAVLTNKSDHKIQLTKMSAAGAQNFEYKVNVHLIDQSRTVNRAFSERVRRNEETQKKTFTGSIMFIDIGPGETHRDEISISNRYQIDKPGRYIIQVERELPQNMGGKTLRSNEIEIDVAP